MVVAELRQRGGELPQSVLEELESHKLLIGALQECLDAEVPAARFQAVVQRSLSGLSTETAIRVAAGMTSLAVGIAGTIGDERQGGRSVDVLEAEARGG